MPEHHTHISAFTSGTSARVLVLATAAVAAFAVTACGPTTSTRPVTALSTGTTTAPMPPADEAGSTQPGASGALPIGDRNAPMPATGTCHAETRNGQPLPDPQCTPGSTNSAVNDATINTTICKSGWTKTVRPPTSVTNAMKRQSAESYGIASNEKGEYDHLISLELGGAVDDPRNLWVEVGPIPNPKDAVENSLNRAVCGGLIPLTVAQTAIAHQWVTAFDDAGLRVAGGKVCLRDNPSRCVGH